MSDVIKRSISLSGHRTSYSIENEFQIGLQQMAGLRQIALAQLIAEIDAARGSDSNLSSALRIAVLKHFMSGRSNTQNYGAPNSNTLNGLS